MEKTHYRLEFFLHSKPAYRRRLEILDKMDTLKKAVKEKGHIGERGLSNMTCYAPYSNYAVCNVSAGGETEWLPSLLKKLDSDLSNIAIRKVFIEPIRPSLKAKKVEEHWVDKASELEKERITREKEEYETIAGATEKRKEFIEKIKEKPKKETPTPKIIQKKIDDDVLSEKLSKGVKE